MVRGFPRMCTSLALANNPCYMVRRVLSLHRAFRYKESTLPLQSLDVASALLTPTARLYVCNQAKSIYGIRRRLYVAHR